MQYYIVRHCGTWRQKATSCAGLIRHTRSLRSKVYVREAMLKAHGIVCFCTPVWNQTFYASEIVLDVCIFQYVYTVYTSVCTYTYITQNYLCLPTFENRQLILHICIVLGKYLFCLDSTGINWKLWTILHSWLFFHIIVLLHGTILPQKTSFDFFFFFACSS